MKKSFITIFIFFFIVSLLNAQSQPVINTDSLSRPRLEIDESKKKRSLKQYFKADYPSPKKAVLLGIIPGMGQIYNKKYWKLPLVYGSLGGVIYAINFNTRNYKKAIRSLEAKASGDTQNDPFPRVPESAVEASRNAIDKNRQLSWIGVFVFYLVWAGDAFVDAHLKGFNTDDDISFQPILETSYTNQPVIGIGISIPLSK